MAGTIVFNGIFVNAQYKNTGVFVGETVANGWESHNKNQRSIGSFINGFGSGSNVAGNLNLILDNDIVDTAIFDGFEQDAAPSSQV